LGAAANQKEVLRQREGGREDYLRGTEETTTADLKI